MLGQPGQEQPRMPTMAAQLNRPVQPVPRMQQQQPMVPGGFQPGPGMNTAPREREVIWKGDLEWQEKVKDGPADQKISQSVKCTVLTTKGNGVGEIRTENWPPKLLMQLLPKSLLQNIGEQYFRNSNSVLFHPNECESLDALTKLMRTGFAGCVHFTGVQACDIKVLILLYSNDKKAYLGFIPNDQASFVDRIRTVIQQQKTGQQVRAQGQMGQQQPGMVVQPGGMQGMGGAQQGQMMGQQPQPGMMPQMNMGQSGQMSGQQGMMGQQGQMMMTGQQGQMMMTPGNNVMMSQGQGMTMNVSGTMSQPGQPGMVMTGGQRMMMTPNMTQQVRMQQSQGIRGPQQIELSQQMQQKLQYVRMQGGVQPGGPQRMMGAGPDGSGMNPGLRQILQQQPGMMSGANNVQQVGPGGMMQMQQRMGGPGMPGMPE